MEQKKNIFYILFITGVQIFFISNNNIIIAASWLRIEDSLMNWVNLARRALTDSTPLSARIRTRQNFQKWSNFDNLNKTVGDNRYIKLPYIYALYGKDNGSFLKTNLTNFGKFAKPSFVNFLKSLSSLICKDAKLFSVSSSCFYALK